LVFPYHSRSLFARPKSSPKLRRLHSASTWPPFRLCARSVALKLHPPARARLSANWLDAVIRKTGLPQDAPRPNCATACTTPRLSLHSGSQVSSLRTIEWCIAEASRAARPANPRPPMSRRKQLPTTHRLVWGLTSPIQAGSTPLHSSAASDQRHRPALPFHAATPSQIVEDRLPRHHERERFRQVSSAGRPRIWALPKFPPSQRPQNQPDL
jgi:hypothetical protein